MSVEKGAHGNTFGRCARCMAASQFSRAFQRCYGCMQAFMRLAAMAPLQAFIHADSMAMAGGRMCPDGALRGLGYNARQTMPGRVVFPDLFREDP